MTQTMQAPENVYGRTVFDREGRELGTVEALYLDHETNEPEWAAVRVGHERLALVPLAGAEGHEDGLRLAFDERLVRGAPGGAAVAQELPRELEAELYHYYALDYSSVRAGAALKDRLPSGPADTDNAVAEPGPAEA